MHSQHESQMQYNESLVISQHKKKEKKHKKDPADNDEKEDELQFQCEEDVSSLHKHKKKKHKKNFSDNPDEKIDLPLQLEVLSQHKIGKKKHKKKLNRTEKDELPEFQNAQDSFFSHKIKKKSYKRENDELCFQFQENLKQSAEGANMSENHSEHLHEEAAETNQYKKHLDERKREKGKFPVQCQDITSSLKYKSKKRKHSELCNDSKSETNEMQLQEINMELPVQNIKYKKHKKQHDNEPVNNESELQFGESLALSPYRVKKKKRKKNRGNDFENIKSDSTVECEENVFFSAPFPEKGKEGQENKDCDVLNNDSQYQFPEISQPTKDRSKKKHKKSLSSFEAVEIMADINILNNQSQCQSGEILKHTNDKSKKKKKHKKNHNDNELTIINENSENLNELQHQLDEASTPSKDKTERKKHRKQLENSEIRIDNELLTGESQCAIDEILEHPKNKSKKKKHKKNRDCSDFMEMNLNYQYSSPQQLEMNIANSNDVLSMPKEKSVKVNNEKTGEPKISSSNSNSVDDSLKLLQEVDVKQKEKRRRKKKDITLENCEFDAGQPIAHDEHSFHEHKISETNSERKKKSRRKCDLLANKFSDQYPENVELHHSSLIFEPSTHDDTEKFDNSFASTKRKRKKKKHHDLNLENSLNDDEQTGDDKLSSDALGPSLASTSSLNFLSATLDQEDELPDFDVPILHQNERVRPLSKSEREKFNEQGIKINSGKFTKEENEIFMRNWNNFAEKYNINDPTEMLGINCKGFKRLKLMQFLRAKHFYVRLAKDLNNRSLCSVYRHARCVMDPTKGSCRFSLDEVSQLKQLYSIHGNNWGFIANKMGKTTSQCESSFRAHKEKQQIGHWTVAEEEALNIAVKTICNSEKKIRHLSSKPCGTSWKKIANIMKNRNSFQCRDHWLYKMAWTTKRHKWGTEDRLLLVYVLFQNLVKDETLIDWEAAYRILRNRIPSYAALIVKWGRIKRKVPEYQEKTYPEIMTYLKENYIPEVMGRCKLSFDDLSEMCKVTYSS